MRRSREMEGRPEVRRDERAGDRLRIDGRVEHPLALRPPHVVLHLGDDSAEHRLGEAAEHRIQDVGGDHDAAQLAIGSDLRAERHDRRAKRLDRRAAFRDHAVAKWTKNVPLATPASRVICSTEVAA